MVLAADAAGVYIPGRASDHWYVLELLGWAASGLALPWAAADRPPSAKAISSAPTEGAARIKPSPVGPTLRISVA